MPDSKSVLYPGGGCSRQWHVYEELWGSNGASEGSSAIMRRDGWKVFRMTDDDLSVNLGLNYPKKSCAAAAPPGMKLRKVRPCSLSLWHFQTKLHTHTHDIILWESHHHTTLALPIAWEKVCMLLAHIR